MKKNQVNELKGNKVSEEKTEREVKWRKGK